LNDPGLGESAIIRLAVQGEQAAWEALVHSHQEPVFRLAYLLLGDTHQAEDVTQEAFIRAYRYLDRFETGRSLRPWLLKITSNLARNQHRSASRYVAAVGRLIRHEPGEGKPTIEDLATFNQESEALWQAVRRLGFADQQIIYLRYFLDLSVVEAADAIGTAPGTIKSRSHRAINHLRVVIEKEFPILMDWSDGPGNR
jgi:RNA polymerase sigma factor (sigma-70 family)